MLPGPRLNLMLAGKALIYCVCEFFPNGIIFSFTSRHNDVFTSPEKRMSARATLTPVHFAQAKKIVSHQEEQRSYSTFHVLKMRDA